MPPVLSHFFAQSGNISRGLDDAFSAFLMLIQLIAKELEHGHEFVRLLQSMLRGLHVPLAVRTFDARRYEEYERIENLNCELDA